MVKCTRLSRIMDSSSYNIFISLYKLIKEDKSFSIDDMIIFKSFVCKMALTQLDAYTPFAQPYMFWRSFISTRGKIQFTSEYLHELLEKLKDGVKLYDYDIKKDKYNII